MLLNTVLVCEPPVICGRETHIPSVKVERVVGVLQLFPLSFLVHVLPPLFLSLTIHNIS